MAHISNSKLARIFLVIGLFVLAAGQLLSYFINIPDFIAGTCMGLGIGIEIMAFLMLKRLKDTK
ncbi:MAG: hypothetical protein ABI581_00145 [Sediminibacterium sp.]